MRKKIALIGLVIFVVGIILFAAGTIAITSNTHRGSTYTLYSSGKYVSSEIQLTQAATLTISKAPSSMGIVTAADLPSVTNSTLSTVALQPQATALGAQVYSLPSGNYYIVYFGNSPPATSYIYLYTSSVTGYGLMTSLGLFVAIAGGIVGIVGVVMKKKQLPAQ